MINDFKLPGSSKQWEGIDVKVTDNKKKEFNLYLCKDSPPELWKFIFTLDSGFNKCAYGN